MDSWLMSKLWNPDIKLYVDLGTKYGDVEKRRLPPDVRLEKLNLSHWELENHAIPLRNLLLAAVACRYGDIIALGATECNRSLDETEEFANKTTDIFNYLHKEQYWTGDRDIKVVLPFKNFTKKEMLQMYLDKGGDLNEAKNACFSCYRPIDERECFNCDPCFRKYVAFKLCGAEYDKETENKIYEYMKTIINEVKERRFGLGEKERQDVIDVFTKLNKIFG